MAFGWREVLTGVAGLFLLFLLVKLRPAKRKLRALSADVRAARARAHAATTPRARAEALCDAALLAIKAGNRWTAAAGFFLRAMNADPTWPEAVERTILAFATRRPRMLEKILWRRAVHIPWDEAHRPVVRVIVAGLTKLYERPLRDAAKAEFFRRLNVTL